MTADHAFVTGLIPRSPDAIRSALGPGDRAEFVASYEAALDRAKTTYSLLELDKILEQWWRFVNLADGRDNAVQIAEQILAGHEVATVPVDLAALRG